MAIGGGRGSRQAGAVEVVAFGCQCRVEMLLGLQSVKLDAHDFEPGFGGAMAVSGREAFGRPLRSMRFPRRYSILQRQRGMQRRSAGRIGGKAVVAKLLFGLVDARLG